MIILRRFYRDDVPGLGHLLAEGALVTVLGTFAAWWLFPDEAGLVCLFLASISSSDSMERILGWNRAAIQERGVAPSRANARLMLLFLALFAGSFLAFGFFGSSLPLPTLERLFGHQLGEGVRPLFPDMRFGAFSSLWTHNVSVVLFFFALALPFRQGGVMLVIVWNASVWGIRFASSARSWSEAGGPPLGEAVARVMAACSPHMAMEGVAYVAAGIAGVFLSRGLERHALDSDRAVSIVRSVVAMLGAAIVLVTLGAWWEATIAPFLVRLLS